MHYFKAKQLSRPRSPFTHVVCLSIYARYYLHVHYATQVVYRGAYALRCTLTGYRWLTHCREWELAIPHQCTCTLSKTVLVECNQLYLLYIYTYIYIWRECILEPNLGECKSDNNSNLNGRYIYIYWQVRVSPAEWTQTWLHCWWQWTATSDHCSTCPYGTQRSSSAH